MKHFLKTFYLIIFIKSFASCQENAGTNVALALRECYNTTRNVIADYRLPSTINVLIELIRKIEDGNPTENARELSYQILHRFRQDGIRRYGENLESGLPFSPKGWESYKNNLQLTKLTPGNAFNFNNNSLSSLQACSLHFMISSTIDRYINDGQTPSCSKIARYTSRIHKRQSPELSDIEGTTISPCPIENGVIYTKWGAVKAGLVIAGIAAAYEPNPIRAGNYTIDSLYASTIAGELAETALHEPSGEKTVGNNGGWNSTVEPKYYFLEKSEKKNLYLTDAEIRGGLDGLYLALNINKWKAKASNLKISQILDLFYGRGVFNQSERACNRKQLINSFLNDDILIQQTIAFSKILDDESRLSYTLDEQTLPQIVNSVVTSFKQYIGNNLKDLTCSSENEVEEKISTDILIFVDGNWGYETIHPIINYLLENIAVNKYESSYTIYSGGNCEVIVNKTRSILDFYEQFNLTVYQNYPTGFDYNKVIQKAQEVFRAKLNNATDLTGQSTIILMLPHKTPTSAENEYVQSKREEFQTSLPDARIIVAGSGSKTSYNNLVTNPNSDIFIITDDTSESTIKPTGKSISDRLKKIPRSVVNPSCGSSFVSTDKGNFDLTQYVEPWGINYHKISPNYFYNGQTLKIRGQNFGKLTICTSRTDANPKENSTGVTCQNIDSDEISLDISSYCADQTLIECPSIYISVQGKSSTVKCTDKDCRFPDNIKYTITLENVDCSSCTRNQLTIFILVCLLFISMRF